MSTLDLFDGNGTHEEMRTKTNTALNTLNADKVEKVVGKGLSTNDYSTAEKDKLAGVEIGATGDQTGAEIKSAYEAEPDTNPFKDSDKTKLTGIEAGATTDQSGSDIKTAYEAEANTNAFTDAEKTSVGTALQSSDNVSDLTNDANYIINNSGVSNLEVVVAFPGSPVTGTLYIKVP